MADAEKDHVNGHNSTNNGDFGGGNYHLGADENSDTALRKIRTAGSISISPELFEKLYLSPKNEVKGDIRRTFGNPTPLALLGFLLSLSPLSNVLLGWRGSGGTGAAETAVYFFFGGLLMIIGGVLEFFLGNTFPFVVFCSFGGFWLSFGGTLQPFFNAIVAYDPTHPNQAASNPTFAATWAFFLLYMGLLCFVYMICSVRTNLVFFGIFLTLVCAFGCLAGSYWNAALGKASLALTLQHAGGGFAFTTCLLGWWIFTAQMLAAVDFPFSLPVGDLSGLVKGQSEKAKAKQRAENQYDN